MNIGGSHHELGFLVLAALDVLENILDCPGDNASLLIVQVIFETLHGVGFACAGLPICKDGGIIALESRANREPSCGVIYFLLFSFVVIDMIERELMLEIVGRVVNIKF